jgi:hypothetical protein
MLPRIPRHTRSITIGPNRKPLIRQPSLQYPPGHIEHAGLDDPPADIFAAPHTDVDDTLEGEGAAVCDIFVEGLGLDSRMTDAAA